jgi:small neutral amino acid transporter SnatA (MarC family)
MMQVLMNCWLIAAWLFIISLILERFLSKRHSSIVQSIVSFLLFILFGASIIYMLIF